MSEVKTPCQEAYETEVGWVERIGQENLAKVFCSKGMSLRDVLNKKEIEQLRLKVGAEDISFAWLLENAESQFELAGVQLDFTYEDEDVQKQKLENFLEGALKQSEKNKLVKKACVACREELTGWLKSLLD